MGVQEVKKKISELREEIQKLDMEDRRNLAYAESYRRRAKERKLFLRKIEAGNVLAEVGILDTFDAESLKKLLNEHKEQITGGMKHG